MQTYSAYYENGRIVPLGNPNIPERSKIIITVLDESVESSGSNIPFKPPVKYSRGCMKGKMWIADDFDAPLDDFKEYME